MFAATSAPVQGQPRSQTRPTRRSGPLNTSGELRRTPRDTPDDLLHLEDFNDAELLRALWKRYERKDIYTWVSSVLVSVNPYRDVGVFREEIAARYASSSPPQAPHLYATVKAALAAPGNRHAILITGESGAGKTEATRAVLSFLALRHTTTDHVRDRLLRSTPVLEAFGNAHTRQNTNSSRFGKFIEVYLSPDNEVLGATLQPYMLEASRVAGDLPQGERTYHVFYLLKAALSSFASGSTTSANMWSRLRSLPEWTELAHLGSSALSASTRLAGGPPRERCVEWFEGLVEGLVATGVKPTEVVECCRLIAAVALLADGDVTEAAINAASSLLRIQGDELRRFLTKAEMSVGAARRERVYRARSEREAATLRASLVQELYAALFGWLTKLVARGVAPHPKRLAANSGGRVLGLLDLYGFEVFTLNGFEQFLINYCNERLQQFFNRQVFTCEAEEYATEGLDTDGQWRRLMAACQLPALALLEGDGAGSLGVFSVINDRSRCAFEDSNGSGRHGLAEALSTSFGGHTAFRRAPRDANRIFGVAHFAGEVFYEAAHFVHKNARAHRPDIVAFLCTHGSNFVRGVLMGDADSEMDGSPVRSATNETAAISTNRRKLFGRTLISSFREELNELCTALEARQCRHVRCLRPNDEQAPLIFDDTSMLRQCRYSGLLEATRIRRQGYAHRRLLRTFAARYGLLLENRRSRRAARQVTTAGASSMCSLICDVAYKSDVDTEDARVGRTKVFLREAALVWFETARSRAAGAMVLALIQGHCMRQRFLKLKQAAIRGQAYVRGHIARAWTSRLRAQMYAARKRAKAEAAAVVARKVAAQKMRERVAAARLQTWWRRRAAHTAAVELADTSSQQEPERLCWERSRVDDCREVNLSESKEPSPSRQCEVDLLASEPTVHRVASPGKKGLARTKRSAKDGVHKRHGVNGRSGQNADRRRCASQTPKQPLSPRSMHKHYHQEGLRLLAQHKRLKKLLPEEEHGLIEELSRVTDFLSCNSPPLPQEDMTFVKELHLRIKTAVKNGTVASTSSCAEPAAMCVRAEPAAVCVRAEPAAVCVRAEPASVGVRAEPAAVCVRAEPAAVCVGADGIFYDNNPRMLQRQQLTHTSSSTSAITFHPPPACEILGDSTPHRGQGMVRSLSARSVPIVPSPTTGFRSPLRASPSSVRSPTTGFLTPTRSGSPPPPPSVPAVTVTPRMTSPVGYPPPVATVVPAWAWHPKAAVITATGVSPTKAFCAQQPANTMAIAAVPTPARAGRFHSPGRRLAAPAAHIRVCSPTPAGGASPVLPSWPVRFVGPPPLPNSGSRGPSPIRTKA